MTLLEKRGILGLYFDLTTKSSAFIGGCLEPCLYKFTEVDVGVSVVLGLQCGGKRIQQ